MIWLLKKGRSRQFPLVPKCHGTTAAPSAMARSLVCPRWAPTQIAQCTACARLTTTRANQPSCTTQARHSVVHELPVALAASGFCRLGLGRRTKAARRLTYGLSVRLSAHDEVHNDTVALRSFLLGRQSKRKTETAHR